MQRTAISRVNVYDKSEFGQKSIAAKTGKLKYFANERDVIA